MAKTGMFFGWTRAVPGREAEAAELFGQSVRYWTTLQQQGKIESFEPVLLQRHGGDLNGYFLIKADRETFLGVQQTPEYQELMIRIDDALLGFGAIPAYVGEGVNEQLSLWQRVIVRK